MKVTDSFQASRALQRLPDDFKIVKVKCESLKDNLWRRLCKSIEDQLGLDNDSARLDHDPVTYNDYLRKILGAQLWDTTDLSHTILVLGNKSGALSGRYFDVQGAEKQFMDIGEISDKYPIFLDTSVEKALKSGPTSSDFKRERDETFTVLSPPAKRPEPEKFSELQAAWFEQEEDYQKQISTYRQLFDSANERNQILAQESAETQKELENMIESLRTRVQELQSEPMDLSNFVPLEDFENVKQVNSDLMTKLDQIPKISMLGSGGSDSADSQSKSKEKPWTLAHYGLKPWDPDAISFLDYYVGFRATLKGYSMPEEKFVNLIYAILPVKYSYIRGIISSNFSTTKPSFDQTIDYMIRMIVGGKDKIFSEFMATQKKTGESMIQFYQRILQYYRFSQASTDPLKDDDSNAFRLIGDKITKAYPSKLVTEFKRKLEDKSKLSDIIAAILHINDNFTENFNNSDYNADINILKGGKRPDWHKSARCYNCSKKGHIARNCYKREGKTKKNGGRSSKKD